MATTSLLASKDQFLCSICLDMFTDPVSTPCGHNFCMKCLTTLWDTDPRYQCPLCNRVFNPRPKLNVNTFISEMVAQFRQKLQQEVSSSNSELQAPGAGEVPCDVCADSKLKALKSCLVCLTSYCQTHLQPHLTVSSLRRHQLIEPVENLEDRMCRDHQKPLELFCQTDHTCVCMFCTVLDHKSHDIVPLKEWAEGVKEELRGMEVKIPQMIQEKRLKIQEIQQSVEVSKKAADEQTTRGVEVFTALIQSVQGRMKLLKEEIQEQQRTAEAQAEDFVKELQQEVSELEKRSTEVAQLLGSQDHLHIIQTFMSVKAAPPMTIWRDVKVCQPAYGDTVEEAACQLEDQVRKETIKLKIWRDVKVCQPAYGDTVEEAASQLEDQVRKETIKLKDENRRVQQSAIGGTIRHAVLSRRKVKKKHQESILHHYQALDVGLVLDYD